MGAYLSEPIKEKETESASKGSLKYGATSMQGWRIHQEDAHNCILTFDENCALFAVYDGHGGAEVSQFTAMRFPEHLRTSAAWNEGRYGQALEDAFLTFDELLTKDEVMDELKALAGQKKKDEIEGETDEDKALLLQEAGLPLDDVLRRYGLKIERNFLVSTGGGVGGGEGGGAVMPKIKIKREKRAAINKTEAEGGEEGPPTPPSSPDARSAAAAAAAIAAQSEPPRTVMRSIEVKCDSSTKQQQQQEPTMSPPIVETTTNESTRSKSSSITTAATPRPPLKRKSHVDSSESNDQQGAAAAVDGGQMNGNNGEVVNNEAKTMNDGSVAAPMDELPNVKRFKDDNNEAAAGGVDSSKYEKMMADSTTPPDDSNDATPVIGDDGVEKPLNGSHHSETGNGGTGAVDSTTTSTKKKSKAIVGGGDVGSPMLIEEQNNTANKTAGNQPTGEVKPVAMDESSGASEDDDDEDYNMDVEDEGTSDDSSESGGIEEDEVVDEQDEMGVDEEEDDDEEDEEPEDDDMFAMPSGDTPGVDSGTTACVAVVKGSTIYVANAGDSRCVLCRGDTAVDLSLDHKPEDLIEKNRIEIAGGRITGDGRVNGGLNLSRAIGDHFYKRNSELPLRDQMITALPDIRVEKLKSEDRFLVLACDGIWNSMSSQDVVDFVRVRLDKGMAPDGICEELCDVCLAPNTIGDGTGCDNMTAIVVLLHNQNASTTSANDANSTTTDRSMEEGKEENGSININKDQQESSSASGSS